MPRTRARRSAAQDGADGSDAEPAGARGREDSCGAELMGDALPAPREGWACPVASWPGVYAVFRVVFRVSLVLYLGAIVALALLAPESAARLVSEAVSGTRGARFPGASYATACSLTWDNWVSVSADFFTIAHGVGWAMLAAITRDPVLCIALSCADELIEVTFRGWLPNFAECWWDQAWDIFFCNVPGILLGARLAHWWYGDPAGFAGGKSPGRRVLDALVRGPSAAPSGHPPKARAPAGACVDPWHAWCAAFVVAAGALAVETISFLAVFGIKAALGIPTLHWLNWLPAGILRTMQGACYVRGQYRLVVALPAVLLASVLRLEGIIGAPGYVLALAAVAAGLWR